MPSFNSSSYLADLSFSALSALDAYSSPDLLALSAVKSALGLIEGLASAVGSIRLNFCKGTIVGSLDCSEDWKDS